MELYDFNTDDAGGFTEEFRQPEGLQYEHVKQNTVKDKFAGISRVLKLNCLFWFLVWCIPQIFVGYTIGFVYVIKCYPLTIWVTVYTSINLLEPIFVALYRSDSCEVLWSLQIALVVLGFVGLLFSPCNFVIVCFRETTESVEIKINSETVEKTEQVVIHRFLDYLRIKTAQPNVDYTKTVNFLRIQAIRIGLEFQVKEFLKDKPVVILKWKGKDPKRKSIMLNSHMDVVLANPEQWISDPFYATLHPDGRIIGRGTQDMKSVGMQYLEAVEKLKMSGFQPQMNVYVVYVPDEEIGGSDGAGELAKSEFFKNEMNVEFGLDEGLASPTDTYPVFYGERMPWWLIVKFEGAVGHGSSFTENTAAEKLMRFMSKVYEFRESQIREKKLRKIKRGEVVTINLTGFKGGDLSAINVIPAKIEVGCDIRIPPQVHLSEMLKLLNSWTNETGVSYEFKHGSSSDSVNPVTSFDNKWMKLIENFFEENDLKMDATIFPASTDSRIYRDVGVTMIGFSPMINTPVLLHDHNEFLHKDVYLNGIRVYVDLLKKLLSN
eukprot:gene5673-9494_t